MIVNNQDLNQKKNNKKNQDSTNKGKLPLKSELIYKYLKTASESNNIYVKDKTLQRVAKAGTQQAIMNFFYENSISASAPTPKEYSVLQSTWIDNDAIEKKNQLQNEIQDIKNQNPTTPQKPTTTQKPSSVLDSTFGDTGYSSGSFGRNLNDKLKAIVPENKTQSGVSSSGKTTIIGLSNKEIEDGRDGVDAVAYPELSAYEEKLNSRATKSVQEKVKKNIKDRDDEFNRLHAAKTSTARYGSGEKINQSKTFENILDSLPSEVFNMNEKDAERELKKRFSKFNYEITQSQLAKNAIKIKAPSGEEKTFRLFTEGYLFDYKERLKKTKKGELTEKQAEESVLEHEKHRFNQLKNFIRKGTIGIAQPGGNGFIVDNIAQKMSESTDLVKDFKNNMSSLGSISHTEKTKILKALGEKNMGLFNGDEGYYSHDNAKNLANRAIKKLISIKNKSEQSYLLQERRVTDSSPLFSQRESRVIDEVYDNNKPDELIDSSLEVLKEIINKIESKRNASSKLNGTSLLVSDKYKDLNLYDMDVFRGVLDSGMLLEDVPTDGIKIDGNASTFNDLQNLIHNPQGTYDVILGRTTLEIDEDFKSYGWMQDYVKSAANIVKRNEAYPAKSKVTGQLGITADWFENVVQGAGISSLEISANFGNMYYDMFKAIGLSESKAKMLTYSSFGLPVIPINSYEVANLREEYLPFYGLQPSDATSFGTLLATVNEPLATSIPYMAAFSLNPYAGLAVVGGSTYGATLHQIDKSKAMARDAEGVRELSETEKNTLGLSEWDARLVSISKSAGEVSLTALFTFRYFQAMRGARNFSGPKTLVNLRKISQAFSKSHKKTLIENFAKILGVSPRAIANEITEEDLIVLSDYFIGREWGIVDEKTPEEIRKMLANTSINSLFSSASMSKFAKMANNKKIKKRVNELITKNITLKNESRLYNQRNRMDADVLQMESKNGFNKNDDIYKDAKKELSKVNNQVLILEKRKKELVNKLPRHEKQIILEALVSLEKSRESLNITLNNLQNESHIKNIKEKQELIRGILTKYPNKLGYHFLSPKNKKAYFNKAEQLLIQENKQENMFATEGFKPSFEATTKMAQDLYFFDAKNNRLKEQESVRAATQYTINNPSLFVRPVLETFEDGSKPLSEKIAEYRKTMYGEPKEGEDESGFEKFSDEDKIRVENILRKLNKINNALDVMSYGDATTSRVTKFMSSIKNGDNKGLSYMEDLMTAFEMANNIASEVGYEKINIIDYGISAKEFIKSNTKNQSYVGWAANKIYAEAQRFFSIDMSVGNRKKQIGFATGDIMGKILFRDKTQGREFLKLYQNIAREVASQTKKNNIVFEEVTKGYEKQIKQYIKESKGTIRNAKSQLDIDTNMDAPINSYELTMLSYLRRLSGVKNKQGNDLEFERAKSLIKQELDLRKKDLENSETNIMTNLISDKKLKKQDLKQRYLLMKKIYDELGIENANSYSDLTPKKHNAELIETVAKLFDSEAAFNRIIGYGGDLRNENRDTDRPFLIGSYLPTRLIKSNSNGTVLSGMTPNKFDMIVNPDSVLDNSKEQVSNNDNLENINFVENLSDTNTRLILDHWGSNTFSTRAGVNIDIATASDAQVMLYVLNNKDFENIFSDKYQYNSVKKFYEGKLDILNKIKNPTSVDSDFSSGFPLLNKQTMAKATNALYGGVSAVALARVDQAASQFYSAANGVLPNLRGSAKTHMIGHLFKYPMLLSGVTNGSTPTKVGGIKFSKFLRGVFEKSQGLNIANFSLTTGDISNIMSESRTGQRNSLQSELLLDKTKQGDTGYLLDALGITVKSSKDIIINQIGLRSTLDGVLDFIAKSNDISLELTLATSDRAAANAAFESYYLQYRMENSDTFYGELNGQQKLNWWAKENKNPNKDAINYADQMIATTMRQTGDFSEASVYSDPSIKNLLRTLIPFGRFVTNARSNFMNQMAIINDPKIPESQKQQAKNMIKGLGLEIASFKAIKGIAGMMLMKGFAEGILGFGIEDDDISRYGGLTQIVTADMLPIQDSQRFFDHSYELYEDLMSNRPAKEKTTKEAAFIAQLMESQGHDYDLDVMAQLVKIHALEYEKKVKIGNDYNLYMPVVQDMMLLMNPAPTPGWANDAVFAGINKIVNEDIFMEFISADIKELQTQEGVVATIMENLGATSIALEQSDKLIKALHLYINDMVLTYQGDFGTGTTYIGTVGGKFDNKKGTGDGKVNLTDKQRKLNMANKLNLSLRLATIFIPGPKSDFNKISNYVSRVMENQFRAGKTPNSKSNISLEDTVKRNQRTSINN